MMTVVFFRQINVLDFLRALYDIALIICSFLKLSKLQVSKMLIILTYVLD